MSSNLVVCFKQLFSNNKEHRFQKLTYSSNPPLAKSDKNLKNEMQKSHLVEDFFGKIEPQLGFIYNKVHSDPYRANFFRSHQSSGQRVDFSSVHNHVTGSF